LTSPEEASRALASTYLDAWSSNSETAFRAIQDLTGPRVNYFGRSVDRDGVMAAKRRFAERWPVRSYRHRPGSMKVHCDDGECVVRSIVDWEAASPSRKAHARGSFRFQLGIDVSGAQPLIKTERTTKLAAVAVGKPSASLEHSRSDRRLVKRSPLQLPGALLPDDTDAGDGAEELLLPEE